MTSSNRTWNGIEGLTAEQVERLDDYQRNKVMPDAELRALARSMAADNLLGVMYSDVAPPADAEVVHEWFDLGDDTENNVIRTWTGRSWKVRGGGRVQIGGVQDHTGRTTRTVSLELPKGSDGEMTVAQARAAAVALLSAVSEIGRITEAEGEQ